MDYTKQDFTKSGERYDVIIDVVGKAPFGDAVALLSQKGRLFLGNPKFGQMMRGLWINRRSGKRVLFQPAGESVSDLDELKTLVDDGTVKVMVDRHFPLGEMVKAHAYVEAGNKKGVLVIDIAGGLS
ncbi:MAG: zinc-binding dehydrogenase [Alphaproteobacteria bacterium]|nr:zinc-binding dehydrogenase [Alphaproteobacteria bacterium]